MDVTSLTKDGIKQLLGLNDKAMGLQIIVQVTEVDFTEKIVSATVSDGFSQYEAYFVKQSDIQLQYLKNVTQSQRPKPIIKITNATAKTSSKTLVVIIEFEFVFEKYLTLIGCPIPFEDYKAQSFINHKGSNQIKQLVIPPKIAQKPFVGIKLNETQQQNHSLATQNENQSSKMNSNTQSTTKPKPSISLSSSNNKTHGGAIQKLQSQGASRISFQYVPISELYPMMQGWCIKARITIKSEVKSFINKSKNKPGQFFTIDILDNDKNTINCTFFDDACTKFNDRLQQGKVYEFSRGSVKVSRYSNGGSNKSQHNINFDQNAQIEEVEDDKQIEINTFNIISVKDIMALEIGAIIDVMGVIQDDAHVTAIRLKTGEMKSKRSVNIFDTTGLIEVTLWGQIADNFTTTKNNIVCFKGMKVQEFQNQKNLGASGSTLVVKDHAQLIEIPQYNSLNIWFQQNKDVISFDAPVGREGRQNPTKNCVAIESEAIENQSTAAWQQFSEITAFVSGFNIKNGFHYTSCTQCSKKAIQQGMGYHCASCQIDIQEPIYKYIINCKISDTSGSMWATLYDVQSQKILDNLTCRQFFDMSEEMRGQILEKARNHEYRMLILSKIDEYQGSSRPRHQISKILENDYRRETEELLKLISK